jgi:DNA-binding transcriptional MocR family regulator
MEAISDLPMIHDMDADYSPQYVKLARILRDKITSGALGRSDALPASGLAAEYDISERVAHAALEMLAANRYVTWPGRFQPYRVTWQASPAGLNDRPSMEPRLRW